MFKTCSTEDPVGTTTLIVVQRQQAPSFDVYRNKYSNNVGFPCPLYREAASYTALFLHGGLEGFLVNILITCNIFVHFWQLYTPSTNKVRRRTERYQKNKGRYRCLQNITVENWEFYLSHRWTVFLEDWVLEGVVTVTPEGSCLIFTDIQLQCKHVIITLRRSKITLRRSKVTWRRNNFAEEQ